MWQDVDEEYTLPTGELERLFKKEDPRKKEKASTARSTSAQTRVSLISKKRSQNLAIMLSRCKFSYADVALSIKSMDERMSIDQALALLQFAPQPDEVEAVTEFLKTGDTSALDQPEQFIAAVMHVPHYSDRLQAIVTQLQFKERLADVTTYLNNVAYAVGEVSNSAALKKMLEVILSLGNFLNHNTFRGGAWGFRLESLVRLSELKSSDRRVTLLHFLADFISDAHPDLLDSAKECAHAAVSSKVGLQEVEALAKKLKGDLDGLQEGLATLSDDTAYTSRIRPFYTEASAQLKELLDLLAQTKTNFEQVLALFGEAPDTTSDVLFGYLASFLESLATAREENAKRREQDATRKRIEEQRAKKRGGSSDGEEEGGLMDNIIQQMRNGSAFRGSTAFSVSVDVEA